MTIVVPPKLDAWFKDPNNASQLAQILAQPILQQACAMLRDVAAPSHASLSDDPQVNNNRSCWFAGYCDFHKDLEKLLKHPKTRQIQPPDEWTHIQ